jgi:hypothetical protein
MTTIPKPQLAREIAAAARLPLIMEVHGPRRWAVDLAGPRIRHYTGVRSSACLACSAGAYRRTIRPDDSGRIEATHL